LKFYWILRKIQTDPFENPELKIRLEEKDKQIEEKDRHIESLKGELTDIKSMHNNYMLQMQTLINQKAIEAPGAKKPWWRFW
jgi:predicted RNase H-like nuclease (RuvC/YqgF family)